MRILVCLFLCFICFIEAELDSDFQILDSINGCSPKFETEFDLIYLYWNNRFIPSPIYFLKALSLLQEYNDIFSLGLKINKLILIKSLILGNILYKVYLFINILYYMITFLIFINKLRQEALIYYL